MVAVTCVENSIVSEKHFLKNLCQRKIDFTWWPLKQTGLECIVLTVFNQSEWDVQAYKSQCCFHSVWMTRCRLKCSSETLVSLLQALCRPPAGSRKVPHLVCQSERMDCRANALGFHIVHTADLTQFSNVTSHTVTSRKNSLCNWLRQRMSTPTEQLELPSPIPRRLTVHVLLGVFWSGWPALVLRS